MSMRRSRLVHGLVAIAALAGLASSDIWIVDDGGGPGVHFTDIPQAIAAVQPGDVLRVMPGTYSGFTLDKPLVIVGQPGGAVTLTGNVLIQGVSGGGSKAVVAGLTGRDVRILDCQLPVLLDRFDMSALTLYHALSIDDCADVRIQRSTLEGKDFATSIYGDGGSAVALSLARLQLSDCTATGGDGADGYQGPNLFPDGGYGGYGVSSGNPSDVHVYRSTLRGGKGGNPVSGGTSGYGGDALTGGTCLAAGQAQQLLAGGLPGNGPGGTQGRAIAGGLVRHSGVTTDGAIVGSPIVNPVPPDPTLHITTVSPAAGASVTFRVNGPPGASADLLLGRSAIIVDQPGTGEDLLVAEIRRIPLGVIPSDGVVSLDFGVPAGLPNGYTFLGQAKLLVPDGETRLTNSVTIALR